MATVTIGRDGTTGTLLKECVPSVPLSSPFMAGRAGHLSRLSRLSR